MKREIKVAHSPDSDDAFMFYGLATDKLDTGELHFTHVLKDIQSLNQIAMTTINAWIFINLSWRRHVAIARRESQCLSGGHNDPIGWEFCV